MTDALWLPSVIHRLVIWAVPKSLLAGLYLSEVTAIHLAIGTHKINLGAPDLQMTGRNLNSLQGVTLITTAKATKQLDLLIAYSLKLFIWLSLLIYRQLNIGICNDALSAIIHPAKYEWSISADIPLWYTIIVSVAI